MSTKNSDGGTNILFVIGIVFVVLKLVGVQPIADWSWWWVTAPFWIGIAIFLALLFGAAVIGSIVLGIAFLLDMLTGRWK